MAIRPPVKAGRARGPHEEPHRDLRRDPREGGKGRREPELPITRARMQVRVVGLAMLVAVFFVVLGFRLWYLQVLTGDEYENVAQATQTRSTKIPAQRGVIYDRDGEVLANNVPGLNVTVVPDTIERDKLEELAGILEADEEQVLGRYDAAFTTGSQYSPMLVKENADREDIMYVSERTEEYGGLLVNDDYIRNYPQGELAAHVLGYTGAVSEEEINSGAFEGVDNDAVVGKGGVELSYEEILRGDSGERKYNVDALGRQVAVRMADGRRFDGGEEGIPEREKPASIADPDPGKDLRLTLDMDLQQTAEAELDAAFGRAREKGNEPHGGAVVAMDPRNGEIKAMAGRPTFDPQMFVGGITGSEVEEYDYLMSEEASRPFTNRAISSGYPAASTFKVFTGMAGLYSGATGPGTSVTDSGGCWAPANASGCWLSWRQTSPKDFGRSHGTQNYAQALMDSNDKYFYQVADWMWNQTDDPNELPRFYQKFGFGEPTGVDLPGEGEGRVPTKEWQQAAGATPDDQLWTVGRWVNLSIGQGDLLVSPLQLIRGYAAIANGGDLVTPHVAQSIQDQNGDVVQEMSPEPARRLDVNPAFYDETIRGLRMVTGPGGTAEKSFAGTPLSAAGKSGTGEMWGKGPVNWFIGWAEDQGDPLLVLVMVENGGAFEEGSELTAGPAVRNILETYHGYREPAERSSSGSTPSTVSSPNEGSAGRGGEMRTGFAADSGTSSDGSTSSASGAADPTRTGTTGAGNGSATPGRAPERPAGGPPGGVPTTSYGPAGN